MSTNYYETESPFPWAQEEEEGEFSGYEGEQDNEENLESELAMELLSISSEEELDQFLGKLARSVVRNASKFVKSPIGRALGGALKSVAKKALPIVGGAIGSFVAPGVGTAIGSKLGSLAGGLLEVEEAESMDEAEAEEEAARRYIRFARASYRNAARTPVSVPPGAAARAAATAAARRYAPSLLRARQASRRRYRGGTRIYGDQYAGAVWGAPDEGWDSQSDGGNGGANGRADEGRWIRRDGRVILLGV
ncbi:hypothetical protein AB0P28_03610 [Pseudarthrobacter sp. NPDC089323]|uniref:Uncharacterized protein (DUF697 family) n=2 Tax=Arthrobacter nitrophenolicus TaxID=683150 RepID=A0ACC6TDP4_9MICC